MQVAGSIAKVATGGNLINICFKSKVAEVASVAGYRAHVRARNVFFTRTHQIVSRACTGGNTGNTGNFPVTMRVSEVATGGNLKQHTGNLMTDHKKTLRQAMPDITGFIDRLRDAFGPGLINPSIRSGIDGQPTFYARENGHEIGTPIPYDAAKAVSLSDIDLRPFNAVAGRQRKT